MTLCSRSLFIHMAITDLPEVVASLQLKRLLKRSRRDTTESVRVSRRDQVLVEISTQSAFHLSVPIQNSHGPVGLQAEMSMETAGLVVHLHVHVDIFFFANCYESCETVFIRKPPWR